MTIIDWRLTEDEAYLEQVKFVERLVMTQTNLDSFGGLTISKQAKPKSVFLSVYGVGGSGKTTLCAKVVELEDEGTPAILFDIDRSSASVTHLQDKGLHILPLSTWREAMKMLDSIKKDEQPEVKAYIWDNMSELLALCVKHHAPSGMPEGTQALKIWGQITAAMMEFVRDMRTACAKYGKHLFMILWEESEKDPNTEQLRYKVLLTPKFGAAFPGMSTLVGRLTVPGSERSDYVRLLNFAPDEQLDTKWRVAPTDAAAEIPLKLYIRRDVNFVGDLIQTVKYDVPFPIDRYRKP